MQGKTNDSLRATGASALFNAGVPEKLIRGVTGHRSNALQLYERPTTEQLQETSAILVQGKKRFLPGKENEPVTHSPAATVTPTSSMLGSSGPTQLSRSGFFGSMFSGVTNITVNVSSNSTSSSEKVKGVDDSSSSSSSQHPQPETDLGALLDRLI